MIIGLSKMRTRIVRVTDDPVNHYIITFLKNYLEAPTTVEAAPVIKSYDLEKKENIFHDFFKDEIKLNLLTTPLHLQLVLGRRDAP